MRTRPKPRTVMERAIDERIPCAQTTIVEQQEIIKRLRETLEMLIEVPREGQELTAVQKHRNYIIRNTLEETK